MGQDSAYERTSEVFMDLLTLLKSRFHHFAENINKQVQLKSGSCNYHQHVKDILFAALNCSSQSVGAEMPLCPVNKVFLSKKPV